MRAGAKILVTGAEGQLGVALTRELGERFVLTAMGKAALDIRNRKAVERTLETLRPAAVLHCAAWTDVDACEDDPELAVAVNTIGARNVASACAKVDSWMLYFSTDYVFDGRADRPYREIDEATPINVYGRSKLAGEEAVAVAGCRYSIIRTSWLYGSTGRNFIRSIVRTARERLRTTESVRPLPVVNDQVGCPTWVNDLAAQTQRILDRDLTGRFHAAAHGHCSRYELASMILDRLSVPVAVEPCTSQQGGRRAARPSFSALDNARLREAGCDVMRPFADAVAEFLDREKDTL